MDAKPSLERIFPRVEHANAGIRAGAAGLMTDRGWIAIHLAIWFCALGTFVVLPWSTEGKALAVLHGLCAQQPEHSFYFGDARLPFDARMTGIYGGFAATVALFAVRGRWRFAGAPPLKIAALMIACVATMGVDGLNSTLRDFGLWHPYTPHNVLRLVTGAGTGAALGIFMWLMVLQLGFAASARKRVPPLANMRDLSTLLAVLSAYVLIVVTGWQPLRVPLTFMLMASALLVLTGLSMAFVLLLSRAEGSARTTSDLARPATISLVVALLLIGAMSGGRFALEAWLGVSATVGGI